MQFHLHIQDLDQNISFSFLSLSSIEKLLLKWASQVNLKFENIRGIRTVSNQSPTSLSTRATNFCVNLKQSLRFGTYVKSVLDLPNYSLGNLQPKSVVDIHFCAD